MRQQEAAAATGWTWAHWLGVAGAAGAAALALRAGGTSLFAAIGGGDSAARHRAEVLGLYKQIMRTARSWPSKKRVAVIVEIRQEFRANAREEDPQKLQAMLAEARAGLKELLWGAGEAARARATPRGPRPRGSGPVVTADQWALDELGLSASSTLSEAKHAYRERAKACHPDSSSASAASADDLNAEAFKRLQKAWAHVETHLRRAEKGRASRGVG